MTFHCLPFNLDVKFLKCTWNFFSHILANPVRYICLYMSRFNFVLGLNFIFLYFWVWKYMTVSLKQRKLKFEPRIKFNHNIYINCCLKYRRLIQAKHWIGSLFFLHLFYFQLTFRYHEPFQDKKLQYLFLFRDLCLSRLGCPRGNWSAQIGCPIDIFGCLGQPDNN